MKKTDIEALRKQLASTSPPEKSFSVRKTIFALMPEILGLRAGGMTLEELVAWFAEKNVTTTRSAISRYVAEYLNKEPSAQLNGAPRTPEQRGAQTVVPQHSVDKPPFINPLRKDSKPESKDFVKTYVDL